MWVFQVVVFLHALCTSSGVSGAAAAASALQAALKDYLGQPARGPKQMSDVDVCSALNACCGRLVLALQKGVPKRCGAYNSVDAGRMIWMWCVRVHGNGRQAA